MNEYPWLKYVLFPLLAMLGGIVNYSRRAIQLGHFSKLSFIVEAVSATFIGLMITLGGDAMHLGPHWLGMAAGMSGWLGADFVKTVFTKFVETRIGNVDIQPDTKDAD